MPVMTTNPFAGQGEAWKRRADPFFQMNVSKPYRDKQQVMNAILTRIESIRRERERKEAEDEGGGGIGSTIGSIAGTVIGAPAGPVGMAIGSQIGATAGGKIGEMVDKPGSPEAAAASQRTQQGIQSLTMAVPGVMSGLQGEGFLTPYEDETLQGYYAAGGGIQGLAGLVRLPRRREDIPAGPQRRNQMPSQNPFQAGMERPW